MTFRSLAALIGAVGIVLGLAAPAAPARADEGPSIASQVGPSLVFIKTEYTGRVYVPYDDGPEWSGEFTLTGSCTGFVVDETGYLATAGHCVNNKDEEILNAFRMKVVERITTAQNKSNDWGASLYARAVREGWTVAGGDEYSENTAGRTVSVRQPTGEGQVFTDWATAEVVDYQEFDAGDNAVLKVNSPPAGLRALIISDDVPEPGEPITSIGFPGAVQGTSNSSSIAQPSYKTGTVSSRQTSDSGMARTEVSAEMGKGMSGGPTVDDQGRVIGINSSGSSLENDNASFNFITDNVALRSYLESHGVTLAVPPVPAEKSNLWLWLGAGIGAAVVLLAVLLVVITGRRRRSAAAGQGGQFPGPGFPGGALQPQQPGGPSFGGRAPQGAPRPAPQVPLRPVAPPLRPAGPAPRPVAQPASQPAPQPTRPVQPAPRPAPNPPRPQHNPDPRTQVTTQVPRSPGTPPPAAPNGAAPQGGGFEKTTVHQRPVLPPSSPGGPPAGS